MSSDVANYANDTTPYERGPYQDKIKANLELKVYKIFNWFKCNNFKTNAIKCHFFLLTYQSSTINTLA